MGGVGGVGGQTGGGDSGFADWVSLDWGFGRGSGGDDGRSSLFPAGPLLENTVV